MERACEVVKSKLEERHKEWCDAAYTVDKVVSNLQQMHPLKSSGPDGLPAIFFQKY